MADTAGVTAVEFAFIASLISIAILGAVNALGDGTAALWATVANSV